MVTAKTLLLSFVSEEGFEELSSTLIKFVEVKFLILGNKLGYKFHNAINHFLFVLLRLQ